MNNEKDLTTQEERLLDAGLGVARGGEPAPESAAELAESVRSMRTAVLAGEECASEVLRAKRVATRVLERSTREDSRRDVGTLLSFAGERLRESALVRVAAALLVVQLTLVPLVAWHVLKAPHPGAPYLMLDPSVQEEMEDDLPIEEAFLEEGLVEPLTIDERLARAAFEEDLLGLRKSLMANAKELTAHGPSSRVGGLLRTLTQQVVVELAPLEAGAGLVETALHVECLVVRFENKGGWQWLPGALDRLVESLAQVAPPTGAAPGSPARSVGLRALAHAREAGVALSTEGETMVKALAGAPAFSGGSPAWLRDLGLAASAAAPLDPYVAAWADVFVRGM